MQLLPLLMLQITLAERQRAVKHMAGLPVQATVIPDMISDAGGTAELQTAVEQTRGPAIATNSHP